MSGIDPAPAEVVSPAMLADLRAMRTEAKALELAVLQLDHEVVALLVADVRGRVAALVGALAAHGSTLDAITWEARAR